MFQFTTTTVINSDKDATTGLSRWSDISEFEKNNTLTIKRVGSFKKDNVVAIYKAAAQEAENAKVVIDLGSGVSATTGDVIRVSLYIGLTQASQDSRYSNDLIYKGKPFSVELVWPGSAAQAAKKLVDTIKRYSLSVYGEKFVKVSQVDATSRVIIEAVNEYQRFKEVDVEKFEENPSKYPYSGEYKKLKTLEDIKGVGGANVKTSNSALDGKTEGFFPGKEGFGTYSYLLHNLRLPTSARTAAFSLGADEVPIVGGKYNQYTLHYCADRGVLGTNAVGDTVKSKTTHVFYVYSTFAEMFESMLKKLTADGTLQEVGDTAVAAEAATASTEEQD